MASSKNEPSAAVEALALKACTPCKGDDPPLTPEAAQGLLRQIPRWELRDEARILARRFAFDDFREALSFVVRVGEIAEAEGHHPDIRFGWGYATVSLQTKKIRGLHANDFVLAAKVDRLVEEPEDRLDAAIAMTFPASDPIAVGRPTGTEPLTWGTAQKAMKMQRGKKKKPAAP
jgi:4a-hydroxytetrahydrobiopterin dehydratase